MSLSQRPVGGILHHEKGDTIGYLEVADLDDMGMLQVRDDTRLLKKEIACILLHLEMEHFNGDIDLQVNMLPQIDVGEGSAPQ
jgi:hypothetical protein